MTDKVYEFGDTSCRRPLLALSLAPNLALTPKQKWYCVVLAKKRLGILLPYTLRAETVRS